MAKHKSKPAPQKAAPAAKNAAKPAKAKAPALKVAKPSSPPPAKEKAKPGPAKAPTKAPLPKAAVAEKAEKTAAPKVQAPAAAANAAPASAPPASGGAGKASGRIPLSAEELKAKIGALATAINQIKALRRSLNKSFYEIGQILVEIQQKRLYEVKGYGSFEAFVEREVDLGKQLSLRIVRIAQTFIRDAAVAAGLDRLSAALAALDNEPDVTQTGQPGSAPPPPALPTRTAVVPIHKQ